MSLPLSEETEMFLYIHWECDCAERRRNHAYRFSRTLLSLSEENNLECLQHKTFTKNLDFSHSGTKINAQILALSTVENLALVFISLE
jgi:hypothetical protein